MTYNTKQKDKILDVIVNFGHEFTIKDIHNKLDGVGLTTIYRFIDKLVDSKILNKTIGNDNITYYQYLEQCDNDNHFYLKCDKCGNTFHVDCDCIGNLKSHIMKDHKFKLNKDNIIINGICSKCGDKNE